MTIDPSNGYIKAMASSADYGKSKFNLAAQGHRQPGSTFKVMVLMTALRKGVDPRTTTYGSNHLKFTDPTWGPIDVQTYGHDSGRPHEPRQGDAQVRQHGLRAARRSTSGPPEIKQTAYDLGIKTHLDGYPAEALGGLRLGVSPLEMADAYATIASGGYRNRPTAITKITFPDGKSDLPRRFKVKRTKAFEDGVTAEATRILEENIKGGTGTKAQIGCPAAGKTGTTDEHSDAWFVGFTPRLATAVWVGYPDAQVQMKTEYHGGSGGRRHVPGRDLGRLHEGGQGQVLRRLQAREDRRALLALLRQVRAQRRPRHRRLVLDRPQVGNGGTAISQKTAAPTTPDTGKKPKSNGKKPFNPDLYESPPQGPGHPAPARARAPARPATPAARADPERPDGPAWYKAAVVRPLGGLSMREGSARQHHLAHMDRQSEEVLYGNWCREVVQRREGLRVHHPG